MVRVLTICVCLLALSVTAVAQVSVGFSPIYSTQQTHNLFLNSNFENKSISYELEGQIVSGPSLRGYHLFKKSYSAPIELPDAVTLKNYPATFEYSFTASRMEAGIPLRYKGFLIEPFFVDSFTKNCNIIAGDKINYTEELISNTPGLGVFYSQLLYKGNNISAKGFYTPKDNMLEFRYNRFNARNSIGIGYTCRNYGNIKISGPFLNLLLTF